MSSVLRQGIKWCDLYSSGDTAISQSIQLLCYMICTGLISASHAHTTHTALSHRCIQEFITLALVRKNGLMFGSEFGKI